MIHVAFAADDRFWPFVPTMLHSLLSHTPGRVRLHVFARRLPDAERCLAALPARASAAVYRLESRSWPDGMRADLLSAGFFDRLRYASEIPPAETDRVIALDVDLVVRADLRRLWDAETGPCGIAARPYETWPLHSQFRFWGCPEAASDFPDSSGFNAGVMVLDLAELRRGGAEDATLALCDRYGMADEPALAVYAGDRFSRLEPRWNVLALETDRDATPPCVFHWVGGPKPWHGGARFGEVWESYRRELWESVTG